MPVCSCDSRSWLRLWRHTGAPRALHATLVCKQIASEELAAWRDDYGRTGQPVTPCELRGTR
jgi:hypothetical protein